MSLTKYKVGDPVIYRATKCSTKPGPRAKDVVPAPRGELYSYQVDKYWVVADAMEDGQVVLRTRRGKEHIVPSDSDHLRAPRWWERLLYRHHFPVINAESRPKKRSDQV